MQEQTYHRIIKSSAWYDVIVTGPFAFPVLAPLVIESLSKLHTTMSFSGTIPQFAPLHLFFINLMGSIILVWSLLRIRHTESLYGLYDAIGRTLFSLWMAYYLLFEHVTPLILFVLVPEVLWGIAQYWGYWKTRR